MESWFLKKRKELVARANGGEEEMREERKDGGAFA